MRYEFLVETYASERIKVVSVWSEFRDDHMEFRPKLNDPRGRTLHEQMVHQCVSEDFWFRTLLGVHVAAPPVPSVEARKEFIQRYVQEPGKRLAVVETKPYDCGESEPASFDVKRAMPRDMTRRVAH